MLEILKAGGKRDNRGWDGWIYHQLDGHEFEQAPGVGHGQGSLACYSPWGHRVRHDWATELNWKTKLPYDPAISLLGMCIQK